MNELDQNLIDAIKAGDVSQAMRALTVWVVGGPEALSILTMVIALDGSSMLKEDTFAAGIATVTCRIAALGAAYEKSAV